MANIFDDVIPSPAAPVASKNIFDDVIPTTPKLIKKENPDAYDKLMERTIRNELLKNKAEGKTFENPVPPEKEHPVIDRILSFSKAATESTIPGMVAKAIGKPMVAGPDIDKAVAKYPGAAVAGSVAGGAPTYAGAAMLGVDPRITFGLIGGTQEALAQKDREANRSLILDKSLTPAQRAARLATAVGLNAATGAVFKEADIAKNIAAGMAKAGLGAGANTLTEQIVKRAISGDKQNVPEDLKNAAINAGIVAAGQGITRAPALRSEVWKKTAKIVKDEDILFPPKNYSEAKTLLKSYGIDPESLSPAKIAGLAEIEEVKNRPQTKIQQSVETAIESQKNLNYKDGMSRADKILKDFDSREKIVAEINRLSTEGKIRPVDPREANELAGKITTLWSSSMQGARVNKAKPFILTPAEMLGATEPPAAAIAPEAPKTGEPVAPGTEIPQTGQKTAIPGVSEQAKPPIPPKTAVMPGEPVKPPVGPIIGQILPTGEEKAKLPPHLQEIVKNTAKITDVTPPGYGPEAPAAPAGKEQIFAAMTPKEQARYNSLKNVAEKAVGNKFALSAMAKMEQEVTDRMNKPAEVTKTGKPKTTKYIPKITPISPAAKEVMEKNKEGEPEGAGLEEQLINMYHRYLNPKLRNGMGIKDIVSNMRSAIETYGAGQGPLKDLTDKQILDYAKDSYDRKQALLEKQKNPKDLLTSPQLTETELYQKYLKEAKDLKYSNLGAKQYADAKIKEYLASKPKTEKPAPSEQVQFQGGAAGFGTQEKEQEELFGKKSGKFDTVIHKGKIYHIPVEEKKSGYITVYHRTDKPIDQIKAEGFKSKEYTNDVFVSNRKDGQAVGYGKNIIELQVKKSDLELDDEFPDGEKHYSIKADVATKYLKGENIKAPGGEGEASTAEEESLDEAKVTEKDEVNKGEFKLYKEVQDLVNKYARLFGERYQGRDRLGVFYPRTNNIFLKSINSLGTAAHEVTHYLDTKFGISEAVTMKTGEASNGNPIYDSETKKERQLLTDIYIKYYPGGKKNHKLIKRVREGIAVLVQRYITNQESVVAEYPELVAMFFKEGGKYYDETVNKMMKDGQDIIRRYKQLDPLQKIGAIVMSDSRPVEKNSFLNTKEKILTEVFDNVYPLEKLGAEAGKKGTTGDPSLWVRLYNNSNAIVINNLISDDRGYWTVKDETPKKLYDFNWKTIVKKLTDLRAFEDFGNWLVARDTKFNFDLLDELKTKAEEAQEFLESMRQGGITEEDAGNAKEDIAEAKRTIQKYSELASTLAGNKISREVSNKAYDQHKDRFNELAGMYDKLVRADLDMLYNTGMIKEKHYVELTSKEGYAPFKRDVYNELLGTPTTEAPVTKPKVGRNKVSSMMARHGSSLTIINPLYSSMLNHAEITKKALRQIIYNKIYELSPKFPDIFQKIDLVRSMDKHGKFSYPQEKDPNILMAWSGGKRIPILVSKELKTSLDELLTYQNIHLFEKILIGANKLFTKGTTGMYLPFTMSNFIVDQTTAVAQTNEKIKPVLDPLKTMMMALEAKFAGFDSDDTKYLEEYLVLGGSRQTLVGWQDMSADDMYKLLTLEKHYLNRAVDVVNNVEDFIAFLPKWSEILTRASEYIKARKAGKDVIVAMEEAGRVTAPFHHRGRLGGGTIGRTAIQAVPFFNASLQVLAQYGRTMNNPETRKRALMVLLALTAASLASLAYMLSRGTKEQKDAYKSIPTTELSGYIYFPAPDGKNLIRLRVPDQMNMVATLMNMAIADIWLDAKYTGPEFIDAATAWIPDQLNITDPARMLTAWIPQLAAPLIGVTLNKKFYPEVRDIENQSMQNLPVGERSTEYTSWVAKNLGKALNLSPVKLDFLVQGYLGRYTKFVTGQKIPNPFIREMYLSGSRQLQKYYDMKEQNSFDYSAAINHTKEFSSEQRGKILQDHGKITGVDALLERYRKAQKLDKNDPNLQDLIKQILERIGTL